MPVGTDDPVESDHLIVAPEPGMELLLSGVRIGLVQNVAGACVMVTKLFGQDAGFFLLGAELLVDRDPVLLDPATEARNILFFHNQIFFF